MIALLWLLLWCVSGGLVGSALGARSGRRGEGLFLGAFLGVLGWVMILGARPAALAADSYAHYADPQVDPQIG
jgi:uncharacterized membrane protein YfcA